MNDKLTSLKKFGTRYRKPITVTALLLTTGGTLLMIRNQREFNNFLREKGLFDEYYATEEVY